MWDRLVGYCMTYHAGIIGAGGIAGLGILGLHDEADIGKKKFDASHAGGYHAAPDIELRCVADRDAEKLATFGTAWDLSPERRYTNHRTMLGTESLDVISVCTPSLFHRDHVIDAVRIADPSVVWCEKPIATSVADAEAMMAACEETDTTLVINHSLRFDEKHRQLRRLIQADDLLGDIHSVTAQFRMELLRNSTHVLDLLEFLLGTRPKHVSGHVTGANEAVESLGADISVEDAGGGGFVVQEDGTFVTVDCTIPRRSSSMMLSIVGDGGKLYLNNDDGEWRYWRLEDGTHSEQPLEGLDGTWSWTEDYRDAFPAAARHVQGLLNGEVENRSPPEPATRALATIVGLFLSADTAGQVELPLSPAMKGVTINSW